MKTISFVASLDLFQDPSGTHHRYLATRTPAGVLISRIGQSGRPIRVCTLTPNDWYESVRIALEETPQPAPAGWPGAGTRSTVFSGFCRAVVHEAGRVLVSDAIELGIDDVEFVEDPVDDSEISPKKPRRYRRYRRYTALERHRLERGITDHLSTGEPFSEWWEANRERISRSTAYLWAKRLRADACTEPHVVCDAPTEHRPVWTPRVIAGGLS